MGVIDIDELERKRAPSVAMLRDMAEIPGQIGVNARCGIATGGIDRWIAEEHNRGSEPGEIMIAVVVRAASLAVSQLANLAPGSDGRRALQNLFDSKVRAGLAAIDAMPADQRARNSVTLHPKN